MRRNAHDICERSRRYLFAVVAGDLGSIKDTFTTKSGRKVLASFCSLQNFPGST
jgi:hypothetical protein